VVHTLCLPVPDNPSTTSPPRIHPRLVVVVAAALWFTSQIQRVEIAAFVGNSTLLADFGITAAGAGLLVGIYFPMYGAVQIPSGILADRWQPKRILLVAGLLTGVTTVLLALSPSLSLAILARAATGVASGFLWLPTLKLYSRLPNVSYARAVGTLVAIGSAGTVLGLLVLPAIVAWLPWRLVALLTALPPAVACLALAFTPVPAVATPDDVAATLVATANDGANPASASSKARRLDIASLVALLRQSWAGVRRVATRREYWVLFLPTMLWNGANFAIVGWLPRYARDALSLPPVTVGILPALMPLGQMIGSTLIGYVLVRPGHFRAPPTLALYFSCIAIYAVLFTALLSGILAPFGLAGIGIAVLGMGLVYGSFFLSQTYLATRVEPALLGTATGVLNSLGFIPAFVYPWMMGVIMDVVDQPPAVDWTYSPAAYRAAFLLVDAGIVVGLGGAFLLHRHRGARETRARP
jgi:sugar phosphate permease